MTGHLGHGKNQAGPGNDERWRSKTVMSDAAGEVHINVR